MLKGLSLFWRLKGIKELDKRKIAFAAIAFIVGKAQVHRHQAGSREKIASDCASRDY